MEERSGKTYGRLFEMALLEETSNGTYEDVRTFINVFVFLVKTIRYHIITCDDEYPGETFDQHTSIVLIATLSRHVPTAVYFSISVPSEQRRGDGNDDDPRWMG